MRDLIRRPEAPLTAAYYAALSGAGLGVSVSVWIMVTLVGRIGFHWRLLVMLALCVAGTAGMALIAALGAAVWGWVRQWAYERVLEAPSDE